MAEKQKKLWDNYREIGEVRKSDKIKFIIGAGIRDGVRYINIREFYYVKRDNAWKPGRDGITVPLVIPVDNGVNLVETYNDFAATLAKAAETLNEMELSDPEHAVYAPQKERK